MELGIGTKTDNEVIEQLTASYQINGKASRKSAIINTKLQERCLSVAREVTKLTQPYRNAISFRKMAEKHLTNTLTLDCLLDECRLHGIPVIPLNQLRSQHRIPGSMIMNINQRPAIFIRNNAYDNSVTAYLLAYSLSQLASNDWKKSSTINKYLPFTSGGLMYSDLTTSSLQHHNNAIELLTKQKHIDISGFKDVDLPTTLALKARDFEETHNIDAGLILMLVANEFYMFDLCTLALESLGDQRNKDNIEMLFMGYTNFCDSGLPLDIKSFLTY